MAIPKINVGDRLVMKKAHPCGENVFSVLYAGSDIKLKCEKCGRVFDIDIPYIDGFDNLVENRNGFELTGYDILFRGICPCCRASSDGEK